MFKITLDGKTDKWKKFINSKVKIISGGHGAMGAKGVGYIVDSSTPSTSGNRQCTDCPKVRLRGVVWNLCNGWKMEVLPRNKKYTIYGKVLKK